MAKIGRKDVIGFKKEGSWGDGDGTADIHVPVDDLTVSPKINRIQNTGAIARIESHHDSNIASKSGEVNAGGVMGDVSIGHLLLLALGTVSTSSNDPEAGVNTHSFTVKNDSDPVSTCASFGTAGELANVGYVPGSVLNNLDIEVVAEDYAKFAVALLGKFPVDSAADAASISAENEWVANNLVCKLATNLAGLGAASNIKGKSFKLSINKNAEAQFLTGDLEPSSIVNKVLQVSGEIELLFESGTYYDIFAAGTKQAIRLELTGSQTIGSSSNPKLTIDLAQAALEDWGHGGGNDDVRTQTFGFNAEYSISDAKMITAKLINTKASY